MNECMDGVSSRCIQGRYRFRDGRTYPHDMLYSDPTAMDVLMDADVVVVHNAVNSNHWRKRILQKKRIILVCHSQPCRIEKVWLSKATNIAVVAQYQPRLYLGKYKISLVPNLIPFSNPLYTPPSKKRKAKITIAHSPSSVHRITDRNHKLFWDNKGSDKILDVIKKLGIGNRYVEYKGLPLSKILSARRQHHIVIDDMITGSYHRVTLEACAQAQMAICAADKETIHAMKWVSGVDTVPFHIVNLNELPGFLKKAIDRPEWVIDEGIRAVKWMHENWSSEKLLNRCWRGLLEGNARLYSY